MTLIAHDALAEESWTRLQHSGDDPNHPMHLLVLATVCTAGAPEVRLMEPGRIPGILDGTGQLGDPQYTCATAVAGYLKEGCFGAQAWEPFLWAVERPDAFVDGGGRT